MATHSSVLAWRIPRTKETGSMESTGLSVLGLCCSVRVFFSCGTWASHYGGFSCGAQAPEHVLSSCGHGLS